MPTPLWMSLFFLFCFTDPRVTWVNLKRHCYERLYLPTCLTDWPTHWQPNWLGTKWMRVQIYTRVEMNGVEFVWVFITVPESPSNVIKHPYCCHYSIFTLAPHSILRRFPKSGPLEAGEGREREEHTNHSNLPLWDLLVHRCRSSVVLWASVQFLKSCWILGDIRIYRTLMITPHSNHHYHHFYLSIKYVGSLHCS